ELIVEDRRVAEAGDEATLTDLTQHVGERRVELHLGEVSRVLQEVHVNGARLRADDLTLEVRERSIRRLVGYVDDKTFWVSKDRIAEIDRVATRRRDEHRRRDDIDAIACERWNQRCKRRRLQIYVETGIGRNGTDHIDHRPLERVGFGIEISERNRGGRNADLIGRRLSANRERT